LEQYKSKEEKLALLDKAIATHDGNAIIAVSQFVCLSVFLCPVICMNMNYAFVVVMLVVFTQDYGSKPH
jgi:hypothetical protein